VAELVEVWMMPRVLEVGLLGDLSSLNKEEVGGVDGWCRGGAT
jgi:hypothetical protein